eukprot:11897113-Karenia_brevis.AAC.1
MDDGNGRCSTCDGCVCPSNQVRDISYGFNFNIESDAKVVGRSLSKELRLVVFNAWLKEDYIDPQDKLKHLDKVLTYAKYQNQFGHGFIIMCEPPETR